MCEMLSGILWTLCGAKFCHIKCQERGWCEATQSPQQHGKLRRRQKHCNSQEIQKNDMFHVVVSLLLVVLCALHPLANNSVSLSHFSPYFLHCDLFKILFQTMPTQSPKKQIKRHAMSPPEICLPFGYHSPEALWNPRIVWDEVAGPLTTPKTSHIQHMASRHVWKFDMA